MTQEPLFLFTLNCGKKGLALLDSNDPAYRNFADSIYGILPGSRDNVSTIYAFAFEELCSIVEGSFVLLVEKYLSGLSLRLIELLKFKYGNDVDFSVVGTSCIGAIGLIVITPDKTRFSVIRKAGSSCGYLYSSLKGACGLRFKLLKNSLSSIFTIVACHLNANEGLRNWKRRNQDLVTLIRSLDFGDGWGILHPSAHCFIMGDLNYRATGNLPGIVSSEGLTPNSELSTLTSRLLDLQTVNDSDQLPNTSDSTDPLSPTIERDFGSVDELTISRVDKKALWGFEEAKITFRPTYKFFDGQNTYNPKRVPSWCDRILFQSYEKETVSSISSSASTSLLDLSSTTVSRLNSNRVEIVKYGSLPNVTISDHKPVYLIIKVPFDPPKELVINKHGRLIRENPYGALYLKPTLYDKVVRNISFVADAAIGWTLYCLSTPKTRLALLALIAVGIYFYMFSST